MLISGQTGKGPGTAFAAHFRRLAQSHHHEVRLPGGIHGGGEPVFRGCVDLRPFGVQDRSSSLFFARLERVFDRSHSLDARFFASKAEHIRSVVRQGPIRAILCGRALKGSRGAAPLNGLF